MNDLKIKLLIPSVLLLFAAACGINDEQAQNNHDDNISSSQTEMSSEQFPHTKPIKVQEARYEYRVDFGQGAGQGGVVKDPNIVTRQYEIRPNQPQAQQPTQPQETPQQAAPKQEQAAPQQKQPTKAAGNISEIEQRVIELTNEQRRKNGLPDLKADTSLSNVAREKSNDMQKNNYFSHTSPTYGSPFDMMRDFGITYNAAGENIAKGQSTAEQVVNSWMNSAGHRKNILSGNFTHIGVGYNGTGHHWTQMFISK
ncbi:CAP domain-containing protein [Bacillus taeanensis]|uniref:SCP domain-containing protein n=1 Tax=Bacillus taeanensis TaxID=273032 RepID=A0A366XP65_9BACI|nr:CAP domain-containing protein [Bacillus taeanensis]RBW68160.1 hypothetical protein DS031_18255 [Bacillus taeanensis]